MGGHGSTRWNSHATKWCTDDCLCLDSDKLAKAGLFSHKAGKIEWWREGRKAYEVSFLLKDSDVPEIVYLYLSFAVRRQNQDEPFCEPVPIEIRPQRIGKRIFFRCHMYCASRVRKLYKPTRATIFGCRTCHKLTYRSAQQHDKSMDIFRRNPNRLFTAAQAGLPKAILSCLRNIGVLDQRQHDVLKVVGSK